MKTQHKPLLILVLAVLVAADARGVTRSVTNLNDSGAGSLRDTLASAPLRLT